MEFIRGLHNIKSCHKRCVLTIGNFDGFHLGHQELVWKLREEGSYRKLPVMVIIFEPQPGEYFFNVKSFRLTRLRDKINYLFSAGVDIILCIKFDGKFSSLKAYSFVKYILVYKLEVQFFYIGSDFQFGACREGNFFFLKKISRDLGLKIVRVNTVLDKHGNKISSTAVRIALIEDRIIDAELLLGHSYCISGRVVRGHSLGQMLFGLPTANIFLQGKTFPVNGVYVVEVYGVTSVPLLGIANIGVSPTVHNTNQQTLEVHLLNISKNIYSYHIKVVFLAKIRNERYFDSIGELRDQMQNDIKQAYIFFDKKNYLNKTYNKELYIND